jgi:hypothetical protein
MTPETEQTARIAAGSKAAGSKAAGSKPRAGVPVWRTGRPDAVLADAVDVARTAVEGIAPAWQVGAHLGAKSEGDRLVTHLFESKLPGYLGWQWYAVLTRNSRSKVVTVDELGLLPSEDSILAPEWVPWAERVRPGDEQEDEVPAGAPGAAPADMSGGEPGAHAGPDDAASAANADDEDADADDEDADGDAAPEDDSDDADGNADGAGDGYDADGDDSDDDGAVPSDEVD